MIREYLESIEHNLLSPYAMQSSRSKGRQYEFEKCDIRTEYQRDRDRILHCKSFRRLKLDREVRDGILHHTQYGNPSTMEGQVVNYKDYRRIYKITS